MQSKTVFSQVSLIIRCLKLDKDYIPKNLSETGTLCYLVDFKAVIELNMVNHLANTIYLICKWNIIWLSQEFLQILFGEIMTHLDNITKSCIW